MKIHLIIPERLGHTIFCTPAIKVIKKRFPEAFLQVMCMKEMPLTVLENNPAIDAMGWVEEKPDLLINLSEGKEALKHSELHTGDKFVYRDNLEERRHLADRILYQISEFMGYEVQPEDRQYWVYPKEGKKENLIGLHMGCHGLAKKRSRLFGKWRHERAWPVEHYIELALRIRERDPTVEFLLTGTKEEAVLAKLFEKKVDGVVNGIDRWSMQELTNKMQACRVYVSNDTGILHLACALNLNVVALFGPTDPVDYGPYPEREHFLCLRKNPINKLSVNEVLEAVFKSLSLVY